MLIFFFAIVFPQFINAEDIYFKVVQTTPTWHINDTPFPNAINGEIPQGSVVKGYSGVTRIPSREGTIKDMLFQGIIYNDRRLLINANSVIPIGSIE